MSRYVEKRNLQAFADELRDRVPDMAHLATKEVVDALWNVLKGDLRGYVLRKGMGRVGAISAESGYSLDGVNPVPPYIQKEGVALDKAALARLPIDNTRRWEYSLFRHNEEVWSLFSLWIRYLRDPRSLGR